MTPRAKATGEKKDDSQSKDDRWERRMTPRAKTTGEEKDDSQRIDDR